MGRHVKSVIYHLSANNNDRNNNENGDANTRTVFSRVAVGCALGEEDRGLLDYLDAEGHLQKKKEGEDGPEIKGGSPDALIVHACTFLKPGK